jgi:glyoxylate reductase
LQGFGVDLLYYNPRPSRFATEVGAALVDFGELLDRSDFVTVHCPYTSNTHHLINADVLAHMKSKAILINTARGGVVDQEALLVALREGQIAAAGLDVTTPEPLPSDHPLLTLPNVVVLPHIGSASLSARHNMAAIAVDNLFAGLRGERLPHCANPAIYRGFDP